MALRGITPDKIQKRFKAFLYGKAGVGKTTAAIQFPSPYLIDTEKGAENDQYVELIKKNNGNIYQTSQFEDLLIEVKALATEKHEFKTLIIDPITIIYDNLLEDMENIHGNQFGKHYGAANKKMKSLIRWLLRLDMNVIMTAHAKNEYAEGMALIGQTFSGYKDLPYVFDLCMEVKAVGKTRKAFIVKTRIASFELFEEIPYSYEEISKRYQNKSLEKKCVQILLATPEQIRELYYYIELLNIPPETVSKWLKKADVESFEEMESELIQKCIDSLKDKLK